MYYVQKYFFNVMCIVFWHIYTSELVYRRLQFLVSSNFLLGSNSYISKYLYLILNALVTCDIFTFQLSIIIND